MGEERHLSGEQIDRLIEVEVGGPDGQVPDERLREAQDHLESCSTCQKLVAMYSEFYRTLSLAARAASGKFTANCASESSLHELAAGLISVEQQATLWNHIIDCDQCGSVLRDALELYSDRRDQTERFALASLQSGTEEWQKGVARQLASQAEVIKPEQRPRAKLQSVGWPRWAMAFASLVAVLLLGASIAWIQTRRPSIAVADELLAQSYGEHRTMRMRFAGAPFSAHAGQRGEGEGNGSFAAAPEALRKAESIVVAGLRRDPQNAIWLQRKARVELLEGHPTAAISSLELALSKRPADPSLITDLASAYFENGEGDRALKLLNEVVDSDSVNAVALFNRASVLSASGKYGEAVSAWTRYLESDQTSEWSSEAREELTKARTLGGAK